MDKETLLDTMDKMPTSKLIMVYNKMYKDTEGIDNIIIPMAEFDIDNNQEVIKDDSIDVLQKWLLLKDDNYNDSMYYSFDIFKNTFSLDTVAVLLLDTYTTEGELQSLLN